MANLITINFLPCEPTPVDGYLVKYRPLGSSDPLRTWPVNFSSSPAVFVTDDDPDGTQFEGFIYGDCGNGGIGVAVAWSTEDDSSGSGPCVAVAFVEGSLPDATEDEAYSVDLHLTGTGPFNLESVTKPSWMSVTLVGDIIELRGTPPSTATGEEVDITVSNCGGADNDTFNATFDVVEAVPGQGTITVQECAVEGTITEVRWNGLVVINSSGTFPVNAGDTAIVSVPDVGTHTLAVTGDFGIGFSVSVQDSLGNITCQNGAGFGTLTFPGFIITDTFWTVQLNCGPCDL